MGGDPSRTGGSWCGPDDAGFRGPVWQYRVHGNAQRVTLGAAGPVTGRRKLATWTVRKRAVMWRVPPRAWHWKGLPEGPAGLKGWTGGPGVASRRGGTAVLGTRACA